MRAGRKQARRAYRESRGIFVGPRETTFVEDSRTFTLVKVREPTQPIDLRDIAFLWSPPRAEQSR